MLVGYRFWQSHPCRRSPASEHSLSPCTLGVSSVQPHDQPPQQSRVEWQPD